MAASRPWVHRTALGSPVVPDVKSSRRRSSGDHRPRATPARPIAGRRRFEAGEVVGVVDAQEAFVGNTEVEAVEERGARLVGHEELAVGEADVAGQLLAASGGVDPDHRGARQRGGAQPQEVLRDVVEQHADVERSRPAQRRCQRTSSAALGHDLGASSRWCRRNGVPGRRRAPGPPGARRRCGRPASMRASDHGVGA